MQAALAYWQPDESGYWEGKNLVLGHEMLWNTPQSKLEHFPFRKKHLVLTMDARLDNREELTDELDLASKKPLAKTTDGELILASYIKWGDECPGHLVGDFAFAIWDEHENRLFCARDHLGIKPFYYFISDRLLIFSNDLRAFWNHVDVPRKPDRQAVANYLANGLLIDHSRTFLKNVCKLAPATALIVTADSKSSHCYWQAAESPQVILPNAEAYAAKLRELLERAVSDRMRSEYPITSHLSGGLDSSVIAAIAARKLRAKNEKLLAFNWLHEPSGDETEHYECANSKTIADAEDINHQYVTITANDIEHLARHHNIGFGDSAGFWYEYPLRKAVRASNSRTILTGWGGDELSTYHGHSYLVNLLKNGDFSTLFCTINTKLKGRTKRLKPFLGIIYRDILLPFIPARLYCKMPKISCRNLYSFMFVKKDFLPAIHQDLKNPVLTMQPKTTIQNHMLTYLANGHLQARVESWAASAVEYRLEYSYPLLDKRIVQFILGVPAKYFVHGKMGRYLFRNAARGLLPEQQLWNTEKKEIHRAERLFSICHQAYIALIKEYLEKNLSSEFADQNALKNVLTPCTPDEIKKIVPELGSILSIVQFESWIKNPFST